MKKILTSTLLVFMFIGCRGGSSDTSAQVMKMMDINYNPLQDMNSTITYDANGNWLTKLHPFKFIIF